MRKNDRVKLQGNRFKIIAVATFALTVFAFVCGAFLALQNSSSSPPSTTPQEPVASPSVKPKVAATPARQPKRLQTPVSKPRTLPPPNTQNKKDLNEDRD